MPRLPRLSPPARLPGTSRLLLALAWLLAIACCAWVASELFWRFAAPRGLSLPLAFQSDPRAAAQAIDPQRLFGTAPLADAAAGPTPQTGFSLVGVATGFSGGRPFALIATGGKAQPWLEGEEIAPGVRLLKIEADGVELGRDGQRLWLSLAPAGPSQPALPGRPSPVEATPIESAPPRSQRGPLPRMDH